MKKISLKNLNLKEVELLSRDQLRDVLGGGTGSTSYGTSSTNCPIACNNPEDSCTTSDCKSGTCVHRNNRLVCVTG